MKNIIIFFLWHHRPWLNIGVVFLSLMTILLGLGFYTKAKGQNKKNSSSTIASTEKPADKRIEIEADRITDDKKNNIIRAEGNVKVFYNNQILKSDFLTLDRNTNKLRARGNVYFKTVNTTGRVSRTIVSNEMEMDGDFKAGVSQAMTGRLGRHGSITAAKSHWDGPLRFFEDASYTNCYLCSPFGDNVPLWRFRAETAVEDRENRELKLYNGWIEILNVPVFYTPYISFPNGRGSGFLIPTFKYNTTAGFIFRPAAFIVFSDYSDLLINPYFTTEHGMIGSFMFRQRLAYTDVNFGSILLFDEPTNSTQGKWQGYVYGDFETSLNNYWRISGAGQWASRRDFFQYYTFFSKPANPGNDLISHIEATGFISPHYINYSFYYYQDNRVGNPFDKILVGPRAEFFARGNKTPSGGQWRFDGDWRYYIEPRQGTAGLLHFDAGWKQPLYLLSGMVLNFDVGVRADVIYSHFYRNYLTIQGINIPGRDETQNNIGGIKEYVIRIVPEILTTLSFPLIAQNKKNNLIVEPIFGAYFSFGGLIDKDSNGGSNGGDVKNTIFATDSSPLEINSDNLFLRNRTIGTSYYEDYGRVAYGVKVNNIVKRGGEYNVFLGHGFNFFRNQNQYVPSNLRYNNITTDIIFNASLLASRYLRVSNNLLLSDADLSINRQVARLDLAYQTISFSFSYFYYRSDSQVSDRLLRQIVPAVFVRIGENWHLQWKMLGDVSTPQYFTRSIETGIVYSDECWYMALNARRIFSSGNVIDTRGWQFDFDWRIITF
ncbi:MAG: LPS-assembly protein LptD [Alphaproteobacteria bacterium]